MKARFLMMLVIVGALLSLVSGAVVAQDETVTGDLEVFSWWTSGGEAAALDALFAAMNASYPNVNIVNATVAGGGGSAARPVLQTRLAGGDPPDSWQVHPGWELFGQYVEPGYVAPVNDIYESEGWNDVVPEQLREMMSRDGNIYLVLAGVHRGNGFWYNKKVLDEQGITLGEALSVDEFFAIADQLQAADITPLCVGDSGIWATAQLLENTLLGVLGPEGYRGLWDGSVSFNSDEVKAAIAVYGRMLDYQNSDHSALSWDQAVDALMEGRCVFNSMGDWAYGEFVAAGKEDNVDFGWVSHPGSEGSFMVVADGFPMAAGAPNPAAAAGWLKAIGSVEAQEAFNPLKGSICARTDCNRESFGPYHNWAMDSFGSGELVATVVHGTAAPADFQQAMNDAVTLFVVDRDVDALAAALAEAAVSAGFASE
ncbi:MAG: carbohydrate ABC transporter substrate-binding protein [Anaerolineae bacterium]|nr:carbohydrate ABC transporter substrate-binding protein [Anaerolineae bacterium]